MSVETIACPFQDGDEALVYDNLFKVANDGERIQLSLQSEDVNWSGLHYMSDQINRKIYWPALRTLFSSASDDHRKAEFAFPTLDAMNIFVADRFNGIDRVDLKAIQVGPDARGKNDLAAETYLGYLGLGLQPIGHQPATYFHDVVDHGIGALTAPARTFPTYVRLIEDSQVSLKNNWDLGRCHSIELARAFDDQTGFALVRAGDGLVKGTHILYASLSNLFDDRITRNQSDVYSRAADIVQADGFKFLWAVGQNVDWEINQLPTYYKEVQVILSEPVRSRPKTFV